MNRITNKQTTSKQQANNKQPNLKTETENELIIVNQQNEKNIFQFFFT